MAWADVPAKLAGYRTMEYGGDRQADALLAAYGGIRRNADGSADYSLVYVPDSEKTPLEQELDYRIGACENLAKGRGWSRNQLNQV